MSSALSHAAWSIPGSPTCVLQGVVNVPLPCYGCMAKQIHLYILLTGRRVHAGLGTIDTFFSLAPPAILIIFIT